MHAFAVVGPAKLLQTLRHCASCVQAGAKGFVLLEGSVPLTIELCSHSRHRMYESRLQQLLAHQCQMMQVHDIKLDRLMGLAVRPQMSPLDVKNVTNYRI